MTTPTNKKIEDLLDDMYGLNTKAFKNGAKIINLKEDGAMTRKEATQSLERLMLQERLKSAQHQRNLVIQQGHNLDCIQCGFKDSVVERYLAELKAQLEGIEL